MSHTPPYTDADLMRLIDHYLLFLLCRRQMERWHPELRTDPNWRARYTRRAR